MKIDQEEFNRKAQHILDTVVKPQVEKYEQAKAEGTLVPKPRQVGAAGFVADEYATDNSGQLDIERAAEEFAKKHSIYPTAQDDTEYGFKCGAKWMREQKLSQKEPERTTLDWLEERLTLAFPEQKNILRCYFELAREKAIEEVAVEQRITLSYFRRVYQDFVDEKITMSRMVELLNEQEEQDDRIL